MRRTSSRAVALLGLLAVVLLAASCTPRPAPKPPREQAVRSLVQQYNIRLAEGFRKQDMNALNTVATRDQAYTEYYQMAALGEGKVQLLSTPKTLRFLSTTFSAEDSATVDTEETWDYVQVSTETSAVLRTERDVVYRLRYTIVRRDGRWLVDRVKELRSPGASEGTRTP